MGRGVDDILRMGKTAGSPSAVSGTALLAELRTLAVERLGELLDRMLDGADDLLFEMSSRAGNNAEVRVYFDTMRAVRLERARMSAVFRSGIAASFEPDAARDKPLPAEISLDELTMQDSRSVEQAIALANMEAKATSLYRQPLWDLHRRFETLGATLKLPVSANALSAAAVCRAYQKAADAMKVEFEIELILYKLFDRNVVGQLGPVYAEALALLDRGGITAQTAKFQRVPGRPAPPVSANRQVLDGVPGTDDAPLSYSPAFVDSPMRRAAQLLGGLGGGGAAGGSGGGDTGAGVGAYGQAGTAAGAGYGYANTTGTSVGAGPPNMGPPPALDAQTFGLLQTVAGRSVVEPLKYSDGNLAADLANAAQGRPVFGWSAPQAFAYAQRTSLIGRMFNELLKDPNLPEDVKPALDELRFAVIKTALKDSAFFSNPDHPVRQLVNEMATIAATAKAADINHDVAGRMRGLLAEVQLQIDEPPGAVRTSVDGATTVASDLAELFVEQQRQQSRARRKAIIAKVREAVDAELRLRTAGMKIPEAAQPLLNSGWSTMMSYHLIRENHAGWDRGAVLLQQLTQLLEPAQVDSRNAIFRRNVLGEVSDALFGVGLLPDRVEPMIAAYDEAATQLMAAEFAQPLPAAQAKASMEAVFVEKAAALKELLLVNGRWFHVYDRARDERRWLKLVSAGAEGTVFTEFNGRNPLTLDQDEMFEDLLAHRIEPIDAPPAARQMLDALIARRERG